MGGAVRNSRVFSRVRSLCAQCGCVNHRKFNGRPSLRVPPGSFLTQNMVFTCIIILRTGGCVWAFRRIVPFATKIVWGHCPPQVKYCGGACPPPPPPPPRFRRLCCFRYCIDDEDEGCSLTKTAKTFKDCLLSNSIPLSREVSLHVSTYVTQTLLHHFKLYY